MKIGAWGLGGLLLVLALASCAEPEALVPDVLLISVDRLDWGELSAGGGPVVTPGLASWAASGTVFDGMVSLAPGGAPAAATLLTGTAPSSHGVRWLAGERERLNGGTIAETFASKGYATAAFLDVGLFGGGLQVDRGFEVWDQPPLGFPTGHPGQQLRRGLDVTVASALSWLRVQDDDRPIFLWLHLAEPAAPETPVAARDDMLARLDSLVDDIRQVVALRGERRGAAPVSCLVNLSDHGGHPSEAAGQSFLMDERALRVHAVASGPGLAPGRVSGLAGVDELAPLLAGLAFGHESRLIDLARGTAGPRDFVLAENLVPFSSMGAEPVMIAVRAGRRPSDTGLDPAVAQALASDREWPGGAGRAKASESLRGFLVLDSAWAALRDERGAVRAVAFLKMLQGEATGPPPPAVRVALGIAHLARAENSEAAEQFHALEAVTSPSSVHWRQALLGQAHAAWRAGDLPGATSHLGRLLARSDEDIEALWWLGEIKANLAEEAEALEALQRVLDLDADHPDALVTLARLGSGRIAAEVFDQALVRRPVDFRLLLEAAASWVAAGDFSTALDRIELHVRAHGPGVENSLAFAAAYRAGERWQSAEDSYLRALHFEPTAVVPRLQLAEALLEHSLVEPVGALPRVAQAFAHLEHVRRRVPSHPGPCLVSSAYLLRVGPAAEAEARTELGRCLSVHPENAELQLLASQYLGESP